MTSKQSSTQVDVRPRHLAHSRFLGREYLNRNTILNLLGQGLPLFVGIFAIPVLIEGLGIERFGILTLVWVAIGYFNLFDFGLGRAITKFVAEKLGANREIEVPAIIWTGLLSMLLLGVLGAACVALMTPWFTQKALDISAPLQGETRTALYLLAASIPIVIITAGLRGILEAYQRFDLITAVRIPMGIWNFLGPLAVLAFSSNLAYVVVALVIGRIVAWLIHVVMCIHVTPLIKRPVTDRSLIKPLLRFSGWMAVSSIVGPIMIYADRFIIAGTLTLTAMVYYATPHEIVVRLLIIPSALIGVLFPAFSLAFAQDNTYVHTLYRRGTKQLLVVLLPLVVVVCAFAYDALEIWLGSDFAENSTRIVQLLVIGILVNSLGLLSQSVVQAAGRPDLTAKLQLIELPFYLVYLLVFLKLLGITGGAVAWLLRVTISAAVLAILASRLINRQTTECSS